MELHVPPAVVHAFLCDLHRFRDVHPLIERIDELSPAPGRPGARRYRVVDRLSLGPLRFRTAYTAEIEAISPGEVQGRAWQRPGIEIVTRYRIAAREGGTRLGESARVRAPRPLLGFVCAQAEAAHRVTLEGIRVLLEGS